MIRKGIPMILAMVAIGACQQDLDDASPLGPSQLAPSGVAVASGGYHFTTDPSFFGFPVDNRVTFTATRKGNGEVGGRFTYVQSFFGLSFEFKGRVTCVEVYDTPVLTHYPDIPAMTANRAKWGGVIEQSNDPDFGPGVFIWFQSIDNGEGANAPPDLSTISGFGDEAANEAFCASDAVPNPLFGPHEVNGGGNIQVH